MLASYIRQNGAAYRISPRKLAAQKRKILHREIRKGRESFRQYILGKMDAIRRERERTAKGGL